MSKIITIFPEDINNVRRNRVSFYCGCGCDNANGVRYNATINLLITDVLPVIEPVSLADVKAYSHIEVGFNDDDAKITGLISQVRDEIERLTGRFLIPVQCDAKIVNGLGDITLIGGNISNVKDSNGNNVDLSIPFMSPKQITYDAGYSSASIPSGLKAIMLQTIDARLNGQYAIPAEIRTSLMTYRIE